MGSDPCFRRIAAPNARPSGSLPICSPGQPAAPTAVIAAPLAAIAKDTHRSFAWNAFHVADSVGQPSPVAVFVSTRARHAGRRHRRQTAVACVPVVRPAGSVCRVALRTTLSDHQRTGACSTHGPSRVRLSGGARIRQGASLRSARDAASALTDASTPPQAWLLRDGPVRHDARRQSCGVELLVGQATNQEPHAMTVASESALLTVSEVADVLRTSRKAIYAMIERGQLPGVRRIGRRVLIRRTDLLHWLDHNCASSLKG